MLRPLERGRRRPQLLGQESRSKRMWFAESADLCHDSVVAEHRAVEQLNELTWVLKIFGPGASALKAKWALLTVTLLGGVVAVIAPRFFVQADGTMDPGWTPIVVIAGIAAVFALVLDKVADKYDSTSEAHRAAVAQAEATEAQRLADLALSGSEDAAENAVSDLNTFIAEALSVSFLEGSSRFEHLQTLRRILVMCAAKAIGPGSRATYYTLTGERGSRVLGDPQHQTEYGRSDRPDRPFIEEEDPDHTIWLLLDRSDEEAEVHSVGDEVYGLNWENARYVTFVSIPVKVGNVVFGVLSVNCANAGAIQGVQRATLLAMARSFALAMAYATGPRNLATTAARMSVPPATVQSTEKEG